MIEQKLIGTDLTENNHDFCREYPDVYLGPGSAVESYAHKNYRTASNITKFIGGVVVSQGVAGLAGMMMQFFPETREYAATLMDYSRYFPVSCPLFVLSYMKMHISKDDLDKLECK